MPHDDKPYSYWKMIGQQFSRRRLGLFALAIVALFGLVGVYAPFLAAGKPLVVQWNGEWFFPLFRYLFYTGYYTKRIDIFFNLLIFFLPLMLFTPWLFKGRPRLSYAVLGGLTAALLILFLYLGYRKPVDPASDPPLAKKRQIAFQKHLQEGTSIDWNFELQYMTSYAKLNMLLRYQQLKMQHERFLAYADVYGDYALQQWLNDQIRIKKRELTRDGMPQDHLPDRSSLEKQTLAEATPVELARVKSLPTLYHMGVMREAEQQQAFIKELENIEDSQTAREIRGHLNYLKERRQWLEREVQQLHYQIFPLFRYFHWEDDTGGEQSLNQFLDWWELSRINKKDLTAALIFGVRISLVVGILAVGIALLIGIPIGALAGYYGGKFDIVVSRMLEIWESMPIFFMLLLVVAITQTKSVFLVIGVIGLFGWTGISRYIRGEFFKQRNLPYVESCYAQAFSDQYIVFTHILPNAIPPLLTLLPFSIMGAITSEAGLSFLGLGEEGSCSWGVLMDEGRTAFPGESYLLWPPAILLTILLIAIALVGDALRDALDPKMQQ